MTLPDALAGRDVCGKAPTGSGKTLAFGIGAVANLKGKSSRPKYPRVLVLTPTRELAAQVASELQVLADPRGLRVECFYGGVGYGPQLKALSRGVDIAVACPGRLGDLLERGSIRLDAVEIVVIDEADRMADMGFLPDVRRILDLTPDGRQTLLFSATLDGDIDVLVKRYQHDPARHELEVDEDDASAAVHLFWRVSSGDRVERTAEVVTASWPDHRLLPDQARCRPHRPPAGAAGRPGRGHPRRPQPEAAGEGTRLVRPWRRRLPGGHRRRRPGHPRGRRQRRRPLRPLGRPEGLRPPFGSHRPGRCHRRRRELRHPGQGRSGQEAPARAPRAHRHHRVRPERHREGASGLRLRGVSSRSASPTVTASRPPTPTAAACAPRGRSRPASRVSGGAHRNGSGTPGNGSGPREDGGSPCGVLEARQAGQALRVHQARQARDGPTKPSAPSRPARRSTDPASVRPQEAAAGAGAPDGLRRGGAAGSRPTSGGAGRSQRGR